MKGHPDRPPSGPPTILQENFPTYTWSTHTELHLESKQRVSLNSFVLLDIPSIPTPKLALVRSFWQGQHQGRTKLLMEVKMCKLSPVIDQFYGFRGTSVTDEVLWIPVQNVRCVINVQHNCHLAKCHMQLSPARHDGHLPLKAPHQIHHKELNEYIINSGALYSAADHRDLHWEEARHKQADEKKEKLVKENIKNQNQKFQKRKRDDIDPRLN
ncbi:hypothetical protein DFH28DRAFT_957769 [Melampsora americana]|nr:hypothetical protein DFH28DRAFT_957769 [Melampsora americana]